MSANDNVFLAADEPIGAVAEWLAVVLDLEPVADPELKEHERLFRTSAAGAQRELGLLVRPNRYAESAPGPDEIQALDKYPVDLDIRLVGPKDENLQLRETTVVFDRLVAARSDVPMLLIHNLDTLVAAHLPGTGTHTFSPPITPDAPDLETWRPWVVG
ncbi:hypothetical protein E1218_01055 [Kribbella turkmenica]|uniref:Uncharacterized protein n=1 Tax=Kribbella turkmenica TaxID=2530375 RepID=A0A4R4XI09_9ACTN|nr:hypothetical protein [Kribbella turkmenica]TDD30424.1 hypothetical protein E1218_01055 [Kribbella turkmenica]